jgi:hypothetical protein
MWRSQYDVFKHPIVPRPFRRTPPTSGVFDSPSRLILVNGEWWSHIAGMVSVLTHEDAWLGTQEEIDAAIYQIELFLSSDWSDMFVEDVRWNDNEYMLEQKKGGVYTPVTDFNIFLGYFDQVAIDAQNGLATAQTAQNFITNDIVPELANHEGRIDTLESTVVDIQTLQATHDTSINNLAGRMDTAESELIDHEGRIQALEDNLVNEAMWSHEFDFRDGMDIWDGPAAYSAGNGFIFTPLDESINTSSLSIRDSRILWLEAVVKRSSGTGFLVLDFEYPLTKNQQSGHAGEAVDDVVRNWLQINHLLTSHSPSFKIIMAGTGQSVYLQGLKFWGKGIDPF